MPATVPVRLSADSRYVLRVNGTEVGRGPARAQPARSRHDEFDLAPHLRPGPNVVAVLVTFYGEATSFWQPAPGVDDARLVLEADLGERRLVSGPDWRVLRSAAWSQPHDVVSFLGGVPVELCDARELPTGWDAPGFDDSGWPTAAVAAATHVGGLGRTRPPTFPYGRLLPRGISHPVGERVPLELVESSTRPAPAWTGDHPVSRVRAVLAQEPVSSGPGELPAVVDVGPDRVGHLVLDAGRIVVGFLELDLSAPAGTVVEVQFRERPRVAGAPDDLDPATGARYTAAGTDGGERFEGLELNGLRQVHLVVHSDVAATVTISAVRVREHLYPRTGTAYFRSDDPGLDALYRAGVRTVQANSTDAYTDCPTREQRAWVGDGVVHQLVDLATNADWGLARNFVDLGDSPRPDGILPMVVVGEVEASGGVTIPDWSLSWTHGVRVLFQHDGDTGTVLRHLPTFERVLRWFTPFLDGRGTLADVPEWNLVDWSSISHSGRSSTLTALWARALSEYAELCDAVGNAGSAAWARELHAAAAVGFEDFWDPGRGLYVDHVVDGVRAPNVTQAANAAAILSGLVAPERFAGIVERITDPGRLVVRSWIGDYDNGGYDLAKMAEQARGIQRVDWDVEREVVLAEPFFSYAVHDAVAAAGREELLLDLLPRWSQFLVDGYDTFGECWGWGTPVHGWSSTPARDLVTRVLGITPDLPGFARVRVAPRPGRLGRVAGSVPTPHGPVEVRVEQDAVVVDSPVPVRFVRPDGQVLDLPAGTHDLTLGRAQNSV